MVIGQRTQPLKRVLRFLPRGLKGVGDVSGQILFGGESLEGFEARNLEALDSDGYPEVDRIAEFAIQNVTGGVVLGEEFP